MEAVAIRIVVMTDPLAIYAAQFGNNSGHIVGRLLYVKRLEIDLLLGNPEEGITLVYQ
ncbi:MAG: hypothetical protein ACI8P2_003787 [Candidatus Latescibacterota bacterium]